MKPGAEVFVVSLPTIGNRNFVLRAYFFWSILHHKSPSSASMLLVAFRRNNMKLRDGRVIGSREVAIVNHEIIRGTKAIIAESRLNNEMARELRHTARNLRTVSSFTREQIHRRRQGNLTNH